MFADEERGVAEGFGAGRDSRLVSLGVGEGVLEERLGEVWAMSVQLGIWSTYRLREGESPC